MIIALIIAMLLIIAGAFIREYDPEYDGNHSRLETDDRVQK